MTSRSWFAVEPLESIDYPRPSSFRLAEAVAQHLIERRSRPGDWVLDPFCGFGTTLVATERLGREPLGFETDARRAALAASCIANPQRVIHTRAEDVTAGPWPNCALLLISPLSRPH